MLNRLQSAVAVCAALSLVGCDRPTASINAGGDEVGSNANLTWTQFLNQVQRDPDGDVFIVDGDTPIEDMKQLREFWEKNVEKGQLIIHQNGGVDAKWDNTQKMNLTYCVSKKFGNRYEEVVKAMADATGAWEAVANVKYQHIAAEDGNCTKKNEKVLFDVRPAHTIVGMYLARAFFPGNDRASRNVLIDDSAFGRNQPPSLTGVLRHELGHTLGFRHEHTRPESGKCFEDNNWRALTEYDAASVMHYPQCNGTGDWSLNLTDKDIAGIRQVYGEAGAVIPQPTGAPVHQFLQDTVATGAVKQFGPFSVAADSTFKVAMSGSGDPDLYVKFDAPAAMDSFHCRPFRTGANEACSLSVPAGSTKAYVMVHGAEAGNADLNVDFLQP